MDLDQSRLFHLVKYVVSGCGELTGGVFRAYIVGSACIISKISFTNANFRSGVSGSLVICIAFGILVFYIAFGFVLILACVRKLSGSCTSPTAPC